MPTNQSSPWGGGKLLTCSSADHPINETSVSTQAKTVRTTEVPYSYISLEPSRKNNQAKSLMSTDVASPPPSLSQISAATPVVAVWEKGDGNFIAVPDEILSPNQLLVPGLKQSGCNLTETSTSSSVFKMEYQAGFNVQLSGTMPKYTSLETSQSENISAVKSHQAVTCVAPLGLEAICHQDLLIMGKHAPHHTNGLTHEPADCFSMPPVPDICLSLCENQGPTVRKDASSLNNTKTEIRSTRGEAKPMQRSCSAQSATKCGQTQNSSTTSFETSFDCQFLVRGVPLTDLGATTNSKPQTSATKQTPGRSINPFPNNPMPALNCASASQAEKTSPLEAATGALVGSVTNQISAIHLTRQGYPASALSSFPSLSSASLTQECLLEETQPCGPVYVAQIDGEEEELPDELENAGSDGDESDCSSIICTSSRTSITVLSSIEEPMLLGAGDDQEEQPALIPSLFPLISPTLYFSTANEKVELLPAEQRRLLKWKMSTITPNVVKQTIARSHFRVTKKSHDWLGCWGHHMKSPGFKVIGSHQKLNHFPGTFQIGRKDRLWRNLSKMQVRFGKQEFNFFPRTFVLPQDIKLLRKAWEDGGSKQKWIIKPPASARGIGIQVIHKWSQMPRKRPLLVQKYLHKPYLISGSKFDLRIYVYVTSYNPLRIYMFSDGLVRFASCKYSSSLKTLSNKFMHLTNYSVNKKNSEYQTNSDDKACQGHKWALKALWQYLGMKGINTTLLWEKIKDIVIKTIIASEPYVSSLMKMHVRTPYSCHELFGFDIMLDENLKPWILEVNISPSLHSNTGLDVSIKGQMIKDLLNLAGFRIPPREDVTTPCSSASSSTNSLCGGNREKTKLDLSADEKLKRAFYLTQRYANQDFLSTVLDVLTPEDVRVLAESEDELNRRGEFERIFPSPSSSRYLNFFECSRYLNILLDQWEQKYWNNRTTCVSLLRTLCQEGVHLGTSDPAHMWSKSNYISKFEHKRQDVASPSRSRVVVSHQL
ncbi:tubulin monoglutamylase TTLL4 isoform X2 [Archocentrus centrarchus]|uniref:tubulin monoglutamylase TTLL4 isoform X2 n=1 Tax=Archocentrus centrarchus TaxID=63155 RepID=UPI0011E9EC4E|nr:tubulin polyglutamylase TTLL4 isoform X2 [Archocentrus centrarchus]